MDQDQRESFLGTMQAVEGVLPGFKGAIEDLADGVAQTDLGQLLQIRQTCTVGGMQTH